MNTPHVPQTSHVPHSPGPRRTRRGPRSVLVAAAALFMLAASSAPALAYEPVRTVHTEQVQAGPYRITVGFSEWPLRALQSLDFTFAPEGGLAGKSGDLSIDAPDMEADDAESELVRHPRKHDVWGLDIQAMPAPGTADFTFEIKGPQGRGTGTLRAVPVLDQPGPPLALSWGICALPALGMLSYLVVGWRRNKPSGRVADLIAPEPR
ncbi:hypothetical protein ACLVWO_05905 [Streptomyces sp. CWNU-52H]|uniref:hypothetical protein n=1 Tax=Streptomyces sp. CWNU-52H TaxID=3394352 RepID=UPI0039BF70E5